MSEFGFPDVLLRNGSCSAMLFPFGIKSFHEAVHWVWRLPYSRNSNRSDYMLVPKEKRGACSTKHAFLAKLAEEHSLPLKLMTGIFLMDSINTPKISHVLQAENLSGIPEAHCYLRFENQRYDFTSFEERGLSSDVSVEFLHEEEIYPEQIGDHKVRLHQQWMREWLRKNPFASASFESLWGIRESCILELSKP